MKKLTLAISLSLAFLFMSCASVPYIQGNDTVLASQQTEIAGNFSYYFTANSGVDYYNASLKKARAEYGDDVFIADVKITEYGSWFSNGFYVSGLAVKVKKD